MKKKKNKKTKQLFPKKYFYVLLIFSFIFIASSALSLTSLEPLKVLDVKEKTFNERPVLKRGTSTFPVISAQSVLAVDVDSGATLYEKNPDSLLLPASTTKIITALVAMDYYRLSDTLTVNGVSVEGQKMGLTEGEKIKFEDLLYGLLIFSANDAAEVLAQNYPGGRDTFIAAMNLKAKELNLTNSHFSNPSGLDGNGHVSTARDLVRVSSYAMKNKNFAKIVATKQYDIKNDEGKVSHRLANINELIGTVDGVMGVKTGWTENARENLVTYVNRNGKGITIALLASQDRFGETKELIDWIFENYSWEQVKINLPYSP